MRILLLCLLLFIRVCAFAQSNNVVIIPDGFEGKKSIATQAYIFKSGKDSLSFTQISADQSRFIPIKSEKEDLGFTNSIYWIKFQLKNAGGTTQEIFLETARPITNIAELYIPDSTGGFTKQLSGDGIPFDRKSIKHRNTVFQLFLPPGKEQTYFLKLGSDGEVLNLPLVIYDTETFRTRDYKEQYVLGFYYGMLLFVFLIYFFFYVALNEKSFLFYVLYVAGIFLLQFSLDGFTSQYTFPENTYLGNRTVLWTACFAFIFLMAYVSSFLKLKKDLPSFDRLFKWLAWFSGVLALCVFFEGPLYEISYPLVNVLSLLGTLLVLVAIGILRSKKVKVDPFFSMAFLFLTAGVIIFILNNLNLVHSSFFTDNGVKLGTGLEVICLSFSMANKFRELQRQKEKAQAIALEKLEEMNQLKDEINVELEKQVKERTREIVHQKEIIEEKNKDIVSSIRYAKRIQTAILPDTNSIRELFPDSFVLFLPKDIVSGDFYWFHKEGDHAVVAAADCTGHGVPGAFMSMIGNSFLNQIVNEKRIFDPGSILNELRRSVISALGQSSASSFDSLTDSDSAVIAQTLSSTETQVPVRKREEKQEVKDGMDIALVSIDTKNRVLKYAGAQNPLYLYQNNELKEFKADKFPIGVFTGELQNFNTQTIQYNQGDIVFLFSDGFADQFGGPSGKKFKYKQMKDLMLSNIDKPLEVQRQQLEESFQAWKGGLEQVDDVCVIGIRL